MCSKKTAGLYCVIMSSITGHSWWKPCMLNDIILIFIQLSLIAAIVTRIPNYLYNCLIIELFPLFGGGWCCSVVVSSSCCCRSVDWCCCIRSRVHSPTFVFLSLRLEEPNKPFRPWYVLAVLTNHSRCPLLIDWRANYDWRKQLKHVKTVGFCFD